MLLDELSLYGATIDDSEPDTKRFVPLAPDSLESAGVTVVQFDGLVLRLLLNRGVASGNEIATHICLPFRIVESELRRMKNEQLVAYRTSSHLHDHLYELTATGHERAARSTETTTYFGAAPVQLSEYVASVEVQALRQQRPNQSDLEEALRDLTVSPEVMLEIGQAVYDARAMFLFGAPGNGKTSIAERLCAAYGEAIWIPRALNIDGEVVRLFDPLVHEPVAVPQLQAVDTRWIRIRRPTIVAGGELTLENLELTRITGSGTSEAPLQMKSNCGVLVVDDFGRQRSTPAEFLNRWIYPLENRADFLNVPSGKKIRVPFEQMIIFSTNLDPEHLMDEAYLRRIPYKVKAPDPSVDQFVNLFLEICHREGVTVDRSIVAELVRRHYIEAKRPMRFCHPRDLIQQICAACDYQRMQRSITRELLERAVHNYFLASQ